jgi:hypothetical protein
LCMVLADVCVCVQHSSETESKTICSNRKVKSIIRIPCSVSLGSCLCMALGKHSRVFGGVLLQLVVRAAGAQSHLGLRFGSYYQTTPARLFFGRSYAAFFCKILSLIPPTTHRVSSQIAPRQKRHITSLTPQHYRFEAG